MSPDNASATFFYLPAYNADSTRTLALSSQDRPSVTAACAPHVRFRYRKAPRTPKRSRL